MDGWRGGWYTYIYMTTSSSKDGEGDSEIESFFYCMGLGFV